MLTWQTIILATTTLFVFVAFMHEKRVRLKEQRRRHSLEFHLNACRADQTRLYREKVDLELKLRTAQHAYIFDLPTHIPGSHCRCQN